MKNKVLIVLSLLVHSVGFALVDFPKDCLEKSNESCHFGTVKKHSKYEAPGLRVFLARDTLLKKEKGTIEWIYGTVLFEVEKKSEVRFKDVPVTLEKGNYLFFGYEGKLSVEVLDGLFRIDRFEVTEGFQATFSSQAAGLEIEPLQAINLKEHFVRYVNAKNLNKSQAAEYFDELKPKHDNYVSWAIELNKNLVSRSIAQDAEAERLRKMRLEKARLIQQKEKRAFFNKVFER